MRKKSKLELSKDSRNELIGLVKDFFDKEREEEIGDLAASILLDFICEQIGPYFYNQGILDAHQYIGDKLEDLLGLQK